MKKVPSHAHQFAFSRRTLSECLNIGSRPVPSVYVGRFGIDFPPLLAFPLIFGLHLTVSFVPRTVSSLYSPSFSPYLLEVVRKGKETTNFFLLLPSPTRLATGPPRRLVFTLSPVEYLFNNLVFFESPLSAPTPLPEREKSTRGLAGFAFCSLIAAAFST